MSERGKAGGKPSPTGDQESPPAGPVWSRDGIIAVANAHKGKVKLTFSHGAHLPDPNKLFNAGLGGNAWRAIDFFEGDEINHRALKHLVRAAIDYNQSKLTRKAPAGTPSVSERGASAP